RNTHRRQPVAGGVRNGDHIPCQHREVAVPGAHATMHEVDAHLVKIAVAEPLRRCELELAINLHLHGLVRRGRQVGLGGAIMEPIFRGCHAVVAVGQPGKLRGTEPIGGLRSTRRWPGDRHRSANGGLVILVNDRDGQVRQQRWWWWWLWLWLWWRWLLRRW